MSIYVKYVELLKVLRSSIFSGEELTENFIKIFRRNNSGKLDAEDKAKQNEIFDQLAARAQGDLVPLPIEGIDFSALKDHANIIKTIREQSQIPEQAARYAQSFSALNEFFAKISNVQNPYDKSYILSVPKILEDNASKFENQDARYKFYNILRTYSKVCSGKIAAVTDLSGRMLWSPSLMEVIAKVDDSIKKVGFNVLIYKDLAEDLAASSTLSSIPEEMRFRLVVTIIQLKCTSLKLDVPSISTLTVCPACGEKVSAGNICQKCNSYIKCPGCGKAIQKDSKQCVGCGVDIAKIPLYEKALAEAQFKMNTGSVVGVEESLREFETAWARYDKVVNIKEQFEKIKKDIATQEKSINDAISALQFQKAKQITQKLIEKNGTPLLDRILKDIESKLGSAGDIVRRAQSASWFEKIGAYKQALGICSDHAEALAGLSSIELQAPSNLSCKVAGRSVQLKWDKFNSQYISYVVVRKLNGAPSSSSDGEVLATLSEGSYDDTKSEAGVSYYYAVFTKFDSKSSKSGASCGPVMTVADMDVKTLKYDVQKSNISFSFSIPKNAKLIEIYRDNKLLKEVTGGNYIDQGLQSDREYNYKFVAVYEDISGGRHRSNGVAMSLTPTAPPEAVDIEVEDMDDRAIIKWSAPSKGVLEIFCSAKPFSENRNDIVYKESFNYNKLTTSGRSCTVNKDFNGIRYYLPVVFSGGMGVVGSQQRIISVIDPQDVTFEKVSDRSFEVNWKWNSGVDEVKITTQIDGGKRVESTILKVNEPKAKFSVTAPKDSKSVMILIQTRVVDDRNVEILSEGCQRIFNLQVAKISFVDVKQGGFFAKSKFTLTVSTDTPLPCNLEVLIGEGRTPIDLNNYTSYLTIKSKDLKAGEEMKFELNYSRKDKKKMLIFRLIAADQSMLRQMVIMPETRQIK